MLKNILIAGLMSTTFSGVTIDSSFAATVTPIEEMQAGVYKLDDTHASLTWRVSHLGLSNYTARFTKFDADLTFDPTNPENSKVVAIIDPTSIETDYPNAEEKDFDKKLVEGEEWFNAPKFASIKFESTKIVKSSDSTGKMHGDLTFLGIKKPVTLDVKFNNAMEFQPFSKKPTLGFSANGTIKRSEWGFDTYVPNIGDEVEIIIEAEFVKQN